MRRFKEFYEKSVTSLKSIKSSSGAQENFSCRNSDNLVMRMRIGAVFKLNWPIDRECLLKTDKKGSPLPRVATTALPFLEGSLPQADPARVARANLPGMRLSELGAHRMTRAPSSPIGHSGKNGIIGPLIGRT